MNRRTGFWRRWGQWRPSPAQRRVLDALLDGKTNAAIASELSISAETVKWHVSQLLAETGLEDRHDLAVWWESRRDQQQLVLPGVFVGKKFSLAALVLAGAFVLAAGWAFLPGNGGDEQPRQNESIGIDGLTQSSTSAAATEPLFHHSVIEIEWQNRKIHIRDIETGRRHASLNVGYAPMALVRQNNRELLVAERPLKSGSQGELEAPVLKVYEMDDPSSVRRTIELPNRVSCTAFCQPMVLSNDERFLYYDSVTSICPSGGNAAFCDARAISIIDLQDNLFAANAALPAGCGVPDLSPAGPSAIVVACSGQYPVELGWVALIEPDGSISHTLDFTDELTFNREPMLSGGKVTASLGTLTSNGELAVVLHEGQIIKQAPDGRRTRDHIQLSSSDFVPRIENAHDLGQDRLFIVYRDSAWGAHERNLGFVVYDLAAMTIESSGRVPEADYYLPQSSQRVYVLRSGRLEVLDVSNGRLDRVADSLGDRVDVLLPGS